LQTVGERYVLVELLADDEEHEVWRGHDDLASRPVAVTRFLEPTPEWRVEFDRRARALEALSDPGIASTLRHDAYDSTPWVASNWIEGATVSSLAAANDITTDDALAVIGQTALALAAAHSAGIGHGSIDARHIIVRPDGSVALTGFASASTPPPSADLPALAELAGWLLGAGSDPETTRFLDWLAGKGGPPADNPTEIGRTALALATAQRDGTPQTSPAPADEKPALREPRPWYDEDERKRVRNRLIALGAIVVIGGAALLRIFSSGAGQATVPSVIGLPYVQAQHQLNEVGLRASETFTTGPLDTEGTVIGQSPQGGSRVKVGTLVNLTVNASNG
jgi:serine/threonine protein kinase